jgi:Fic family protein
VPRADLWGRLKTQLDTLKEETLPEGALDTAVRTAIRAAAFDTGAIEGLYKTDRGLTMTVATQAAAWQATVDEKAPDARAYFEAQLEAYELVFDVVTSARPVTEAWIRQLHEVLTGPQATYEVQTPVGPQLRALPRGRYKTDSSPSSSWWPKPVVRQPAWSLTRFSLLAARARMTSYASSAR